MVSRHRAAAHTMLKNWGRALADAKAALDVGVLTQLSALKASKRGAKAALKLQRKDEARMLLHM